jgi:photosystem II stability/assembly factor-like uncharacterized protein
VLHTDDYGRSWSVDTLPITTRAGSGPQSIAFRDDRNGIALGGGDATAASDVLAAATSDGGKHWTPRARPPLRTGVRGGVYVPKAARPTIVAVGPSGAVWSNDEGVTWIPCLPPDLKPHHSGSSGRRDGHRAEDGSTACHELPAHRCLHPPFAYERG